MFSFASVEAPGLDRKRLIDVVFVAGLLVRVFDCGLDGFGGGERPVDKGFEEVDLQYEISKQCCLGKIELAHLRVPWDRDWKRSCCLV